MIFPVVPSHQSYPSDPSGANNKCQNYFSGLLHPTSPSCNYPLHSTPCVACYVRLDKGALISPLAWKSPGPSSPIPPAAFRFSLGSRFQPLERNISTSRQLKTYNFLVFYRKKGRVSKFGKGNGELLLSLDRARTDISSNGYSSRSRRV